MRSRIGQALGEAQIEAILAKKFCAPEYAFMPQMNQGTGSHAGRRADAIAFSLWPSRGLTLHGFEIKVSRSDFASELKKPEKAEALQRFCDHWWIVTPAGLITDLDLLPANWGHMEVTGAQVKVRKQAPKLEAEGLTRPAIAAMFRAFHETVPYLKENYVCVDDIEATVRERAEHRIKGMIRDHSDELSRLKAAVEEFERRSGIAITQSWEMGRIGDVVNIIAKAGGPWQFDRMLLTEAAKLRDALAAVDSAIAIFQSPHDADGPASAATSAESTREAEAQPRSEPTG